MPWPPLDVHWPPSQSDSAAAEDIPDDQVLVACTPPAVISLKGHEGWAPTPAAPTLW